MYFSPIEVILLSKNIYLIFNIQEIVKNKNLGSLLQNKPF